MEKIKVGVIGSGAISHTYLKNLTRNFSILDIVGCSDLIPEKSAKRAEEFGIRQMTTEEILSDPEIKIVVNITEIFNHYKVTKMALEAGKHVYVEKMMCTTLAEAEEIAALAKEKGLRVAAGPDTQLGGAIQTCRKLIDDGFIGTVQSAHILLARGVHNASPTERPIRPGYTTRGTTIPYDMGSYYLHAAQFLLGPVTRVAGFGRSYEGRIFKHPAHPRYGQLTTYESPTIVQATLEFASGVYANYTCTGEEFEEIPRLEIHGSAGILCVPDPNCYDGPVLLRRVDATGKSKFYQIPLTHDFGVNEHIYVDWATSTEAERWASSFRGVGVADLAWAIKNDRPHRLPIINGMSALEINEAIADCSVTGNIHTMKYTAVQSKPLRAGFIGAAREAVFDD